jgi:hypothetical protein
VFYESEGGMKELIGFNMIAFVMTLVVVWFFGWELERKDKLIFILGEPVIVGILSVGVYLM